MSIGVWCWSLKLFTCKAPPSLSSKDSLSRRKLLFPSMLTINMDEGISLLQDFLSLEILRCNIFALANFYQLPRYLNIGRTVRQGRQAGRQAGRQGNYCASPKSEPTRESWSHRIYVITLCTKLLRPCPSVSSFHCVPHSILPFSSSFN